MNLKLHLLECLNIMFRSRKFHSNKPIDNALLNICRMFFFIFQPSKFFVFFSRQFIPIFIITVVNECFLFVHRISQIFASDAASRNYIFLIHYFFFLV
ncbi:MAG: hypothetical protein CVV47_13490 [Spirochaetae bacterium HGW-Spirochaetae-3]|nr:MAG: hypothetical protein CVV47_13490 [Spirochaetae bacterium HGW-Spirochaetae-3]